MKLAKMMNMQKKIRYVIGSFLLLAALGSLTTSLIAALCYLLISAITIPEISQRIKISKKIKWVTCIMAVIVSGVAIERLEAKKIETAKRKHAFRDSVWLSTLTETQMDSVLTYRKDSVKAVDEERRRIAAQKVEEEAQKKVMKKLPRIQGAVKSYLKYENVLRDPKSYEDRGWYPPRAYDGRKYRYTIRHRFASKNGFGGYSVSTMEFYLDDEFHIVDVIRL